MKDLASLAQIKTFFEKAGFDSSKKDKMTVTLMKVIRDKMESEKPGPVKTLIELDPSGTKFRKLNIDKKKLIALKNKKNANNLTA